MTKDNTQIWLQKKKRNQPNISATLLDIQLPWANWEYTDTQCKKVILLT